MVTGCGIISENAQWKSPRLFFTLLTIGRREPARESTLVERAAKGDAQAYGELVREHQQRVFGLVRRFVDNRDDAEDVAQQVFVQAYASLPTFRAQAKFSTWLYRIAVNAALRYGQRAAVCRHESIDEPGSALADTLASDSGDPQRCAEQSEVSALVRRAVMELPEKHRVVVVLHYFEGMSCDQIAELVGCGVGTVWSRLHYACAKLKDSLSHAGGLTVDSNVFS